MKTILILIVLVIAGSCFAQTEIKKSSISTGGGSATAGNTTIIYSIGEVAVQETEQGSIQLSEGFIGLDMAVKNTLGLNKYGKLYNIKVYPNPVKNILNIDLPYNHNVELYLYNITGEMVLKKRTNRNPAQINISGLKPGIYLLSIIDQINHKFKNIKIQKL